jgi:uncharacterized membrane protein
MSDFIAQLKAKSYTNAAKVLQSELTTVDTYYPIVGGVILDWVKPNKVSKIVKRMTRGKFE